VSRLRRAHNVVGAGVQHLAHRFELGRDAIDELLRRDALARRGLLHFEPVFVHAGDEQGLAPIEAHEALDRIRRDALVRMADMRRAIGVRDRRGDVEAAHERPLKQKFLSGDENLAPPCLRVCARTVSAPAPTRGGGCAKVVHSAKKQQA
jgi:hypothetical protein